MLVFENRCWSFLGEDSFTLFPKKIQLFSRISDEKHWLHVESRCYILDSFIHHLSMQSNCSISTTSSSDVSEMPKLLRPMSASVSSSSLNRLAYARCLKPLLGSRYVNSWPIISIILASGTWWWMRLVMLSMSPGEEDRESAFSEHGS